jgi:hypothetical protein
VANLELTLTKEEHKDALDAIRKELAAFMAFHKCEKLKIKRAKPAKLKELFN